MITDRINITVLEHYIKQALKVDAKNNTQIDT